MNMIVIGAGMIGRAISYDLLKYSNFENITIIDKDKKNLELVKFFLKKYKLNYCLLDLNNKKELQKQFQKNDIAISAVPYTFNLKLTKTAIKNKCHFLDLGGNNDVVNSQRKLFNHAKSNNVIVLPDCGLSPGLTSIITRDLVDNLDEVDSVKIRVGGLPVDPKPPFNYQIVFSPNGLINEYLEDAIVLENGKIQKKPSMTELEEITFPEPFGTLEAFITSGGTSTLPYTYKNKIKFLDDKTIRYPGHCKKFKLFLDLGMGDIKPLKIGDQSVVPRDILINLLLKYIPTKGQDVVLIKVMGYGKINIEKVNIEYILIDYYDKDNNITAMMRTTGYPISIIAQMIGQKIITKPGVYSNEEIVPTKLFFAELKKRNIVLKKKVNRL